MNQQPIVTFGYSHPFWMRAIELRGQDWSYAMIADAANREGYPLTYKQISRGLAKAPKNLNLPAKSSKWLRSKYEDLEKEFNAFTSMRDLSQEALALAGDAQEELDADDGTMTNLRRQHLEMTRDRWLKLSFDWAEKTARVEIEVGTLIAQTAQKTEKPEPIDGEVVRTLLEDFNSKLPLMDEAQLAKIYGGENIRMSAPEEHEPEDDEI